MTLFWVFWSYVATGFDSETRLRELSREAPRITAAEALSHPYFERLHEQCEVVACVFRVLNRGATPLPA